MMKYSLFLVCICFMFSFPLLGQATYEREFRIKKSEFPQTARALVEEDVMGARRIRYYKEIDSVIVRFIVQFKKERLLYKLVFGSSGDMEDIKLLVKEVDVPEEVFESMSKHIGKDFRRYKIRILYQQYPVTGKREIKTVMRDAFQNLLLPYIQYELLVSCRTDPGREEYIYLFDADGSFISRRKSLPPNYDHVLY